MAIGRHLAISLAHLCSRRLISSGVYCFRLQTIIRNPGEIGKYEFGAGSSDDNANRVTFDAAKRNGLSVGRPDLAGLTDQSIADVRTSRVNLRSSLACRLNPDTV